MSKCTSIVCSTVQLYNSFPFLMGLLPGPHQTVQHIWNETKTFIREEVKEHKVSRDPSDPRDYIDCFLNEIQTVNDTITPFTMKTLKNFC